MTDLEALYKSSWANKERLRAHKGLCGCIDCQNTYPFEAIKDWAADQKYCGAEADTAHCPECANDMVVAVDDPEILKQLHDKYGKRGYAFSFRIESGAFDLPLDLENATFKVDAKERSNPTSL